MNWSALPPTRSKAIATRESMCACIFGTLCANAIRQGPSVVWIRLQSRNLNWHGGEIGVQSTRCLLAICGCLWEAHTARRGHWRSIERRDVDTGAVSNGTTWTLEQYRWHDVDTRTVSNGATWAWEE